MKVFGFVGDSGTGKSYRAMWVAKEKGLPCMIDDGLLIMGGRIVAGKSAKREKTMFASVRRAIFEDPAHIAEVSTKIKILAPDGILILGTSKRMVERIAARLSLPEITEYVMIEDVASKDEIQKAQDMRMKQGKHIIPVPAFEVKKDFSGYFIDPLRIFFHGKEKYSAEKTIVRPTYSYLGDYTLSRSATASICRHEGNKVSGIHVVSVKVQHTPIGAHIEIDVTMEMGCDIRKAAYKVQNNVAAALEEYAALVVSKIDIKVMSLK